MLNTVKKVSWYKDAVYISVANNTTTNLQAVQFWCNFTSKIKL